ISVEASAETRARRRYTEMCAAGREVNYEDVLANVIQRDHIDSTRAESPLRRADDAISLDNSNMSLDEQDAWLLEKFNEAVAARS
ncbi:MAG: (d)CMP kinase, partial [Muribaculaceae bacterium]|nr:(d)CMP kinase [Muribaculaceae bacterium]